MPLTVQPDRTWPKGPPSLREPVVTTQTVLARYKSPIAVAYILTIPESSTWALTDEVHCANAGSTRIRSVHGPTKPLQRAERKAQPTQAISGWPDTALEKAIDALQHMHSLARIALRWAQSQSYHLEKWCAAFQ